MSRLEMLRQALIARGVLAPQSLPLDSSASARPWFVSLVLGFAGWLAGVFALIFISLVFTPDSAGEYAFAGLVTLAAAYGLYTVNRESSFFDQLALALSIAGQLAMILAGGEIFESAAGIAAFVAIMQVILFVMMPNRLAKLLAALLACIAWAVTVRFAWWSDDLGTLRETSLLAALIGWLLVWLPVALLAHALIRSETAWMARGAQHFARPALSGLLVALALGTWVSEPFGSLQFWSEPNTNWLALWPLLGAVAALFAAISAFRLRHRALVGLAILSALLHIVQLYFLLGVTLLVKSGIMLVCGLLLTVAAIAVERRTSTQQERAP